MVLTKADDKTLETFNEDEAPSQQPATYPKNDQREDPLSRETFL